MRRAAHAVVAVTLAAGMASVGAVAHAGTTATKVTPRWAKHVRNYHGGLSGTVRMSLRKAVIAAQSGSSHYTGPAAGRSGAAPADQPITTNLQVNADSDPNVPQNEEAVAISTDDPLTAVVASNDYVDGGLFIGTTHDGGNTWKSWFEASRLVETGDFCSGGDPSVVYSARDHVFYASQLCFFRAHPESAMEVIQSKTGDSWTPARFATEPISNVSFDNEGNLVVDEADFYDKEQLAVDNNPGSPHFGRLYVTYIKFHFTPEGFGDYCPVQLAYTDKVDPDGDGRLADTEWTNRPIMPDFPGDDGVSRSSNQGAQPAVDDQGGLGISFFQEDCNTSLDHFIFFRRLDPSGNLGPVVPVTTKRDFRDNPDESDHLPNKNARLPASTGAPLVWNDGKKTFQLVTQNYINGDGHVTGTPSGADITYTESHDYGSTWSRMAFVSVQNGQPAPQDQFLPWMDVDKDGSVTHAIWLDNRRDPNDTLIETYEAESFNFSAVQHNKRISTASWNPNNAFFTSGSFIGDYIGLAEGPPAPAGSQSDEYEYRMWTDGRNSPGPPEGDADIFTVPN